MIGGCVGEFVAGAFRRQTVRFVAVGAYNALFGYIAFLTLYTVLKQVAHYNVILVVAYFVSVSSAYLLQRRFVFQSQCGRLKGFLRFNLVNIGGLFINMGALTCVVNYVTPNIALAQAVSTVVTSAFLYVGHLLFSFGRKNS